MFHFSVSFFNYKPSEHLLNSKNTHTFPYLSLEDNSEFFSFFFFCSYFLPFFHPSFPLYQPSSFFLFFTLSFVASLFSFCKVTFFLSIHLVSPFPGLVLIFIKKVFLPPPVERLYFHFVYTTVLNFFD